MKIINTLLYTHKKIEIKDMTLKAEAFCRAAGECCKLNYLYSNLIRKKR